MMHRLLLAVLLAAACGGGPNVLDGSIAQSQDLSFDTVELRYLSDQSVYQRSDFKDLDEEGTSTDTVAKVTFHEPAGGVIVDQLIDLLTPQSEGRVERITAHNDPFPADLATASVTFRSPPVVDEIVSGEFAVTFSNGKTLNGAFQTKLAQASFQ